MTLMRFACALLCVSNVVTLAAVLWFCTRNRRLRAENSDLCDRITEERKKSHTLRMRVIQAAVYRDRLIDIIRKTPGAGLPSPDEVKEMMKGLG